MDSRSSFDLTRPDWNVPDRSLTLLRLNDFKWVNNGWKEWGEGWGEGVSCVVHFLSSQQRGVLAGYAYRAARTWNGSRSTSIHGRMAHTARTNVGGCGRIVKDKSSKRYVCIVHVVDEDLNVGSVFERETVWSVDFSGWPQPAAAVPRLWLRARLVHFSKCCLHLTRTVVVVAAASAASAASAKVQWKAGVCPKAGPKCWNFQLLPWRRTVVPSSIQPNQIAVSRGCQRFHLFLLTFSSAPPTSSWLDSVHTSWRKKCPVLVAGIAGMRVAVGRWRSSLLMILLTDDGKRNRGLGPSCKCLTDNRLCHSALFLWFYVFLVGVFAVVSIKCVGRHLATRCGRRVKCWRRLNLRGSRPFNG